MVTRLRPMQNGLRVAYNIAKCSSLNEITWISNKNWLKSAAKWSFDNKLASIGSDNGLAPTR